MIKNEIQHQSILPPIIFVHNGNQLYFKCAILHALKTQINTRIIILGDNSLSTKDFPSKYRHNIEIHSTVDYFKVSKDFEKIYRHMSPNSVNFELICFQRWFLILSFLQANDIKACWCCDSDVLVYSDLSKIAETRLHNKEISIVNEICPCCTYFSQKALNNFCKFIIEQYTDKTQLSRLESLWQTKKTHNDGGICDMTMFQLYEKDNPDSIHDFGVIEDNSLFDERIASSQGLITKHEHKEIHFIKRIPFCYTINSLNPVRMDVLHFQGGEKRFLAYYAFVPLWFKVLFFIEFFSFKQFLIDNFSVQFRQSFKKIFLRK